MECPPHAHGRKCYDDDQPPHREPHAAQSQGVRRRVRNHESYSSRAQSLLTGSPLS
jgi:hypothetical protein